MAEREFAVGVVAALAGYTASRLAVFGEWSLPGQWLIGILAALMAGLTVAAENGVPTRLAGVIALIEGIAVTGWAIWSGGKATD